MVVTDFSQYSKEELTETLRLLKSYRAALKQVGNRATLIDSKNPKEKFFRIEYAPGISEDFLKNFAENACKTYFPEVATARKEYVLNEKIIGGIRVFYGDDMMDLSFQDFVHALNAF